VINGVVFPLDPFAETDQRWDARPIIYAQQHPNMDALVSDFSSEIARIGGREVGYLTNPRIEMAGHPRLMADAVITDPDVDQKIDAGVISLSTGFYASDDGKRITGNVIPNHVLVFDESLWDQPRDLGSGFLNKFLNKENYDNTTVITKLNESRLNMTEENRPPETLSAEQVAKLEKIDVAEYLNMEQKFKEFAAQAEAYQKELFSKNKDLEAKLTHFAQMEKDSKWENLTRVLPKGLVTGAELQKTREWLNKDPEGLITHIIDIMGREQKVAIAEQGRQYLQAATKDIKNKSNDLCTGIFIDGEEVQ
jgi:hypothetical protein